MLGTVIDGVALVLSDDDNVATATEDLPEETVVAIDESLPDPPSKQIELCNHIEFGHKFALTTIQTGEPVCKYGEIIGTATREISPGEWVHTHNCESERGRGDTEAV